MKKQGGFTLLEIMLSLMIVGLIASVAGSAIVAGLNGYLAAKENQALAQKSQLAMLRLSRQLSEFVNIPNQSSNAGANSIIVESLSPAPISTVRTFAIGLDGSQLKIAEGARGSTPVVSSGDVLVDGVSSFTLLYFGTELSGYGGTWNPASDPLQRLATIQVALVLARPDGVTRTFMTQVHPRNINSVGGIASDIAQNAPAMANYPTGCFVATAAFGRDDHPMVLILREFRDRCLLTWDGGKALVRAYYSAGPALASLIEGRPWACGLAQFVLLPFVVFAFLALYFPAGIPIALFALWALFKKSRHNLHFRKGV
jgi:prepilin-type N-terminal cleavage/methylation domain-containing protein